MQNLCHISYRFN